MAHRGFKEIFAELRNTNAFWAEKAKLSFARDVYLLMQRRGKNKKQLAEAVGSTSAYITKALRGDTNFTIDSMVKMVRALDGELHIHVSAAEDSSKWLNTIDCSSEDESNQLVGIRFDVPYKEEQAKFDFISDGEESERAIA